MLIEATLLYLLPNFRLMWLTTSFWSNYEMLPYLVENINVKNMKS